MQLSLIMKTFLNFLWNFPFLGFIYAIITGISGLLWCLTIIGLPLGLGLLQFSLFLFWPHGYAMVSKGDLEILTEKKRPLWWKIFALIIRIIYFPFGLVHAMFMACVGLIEFFTIIGIPPRTCDHEINQHLFQSGQQSPRSSGCCRPDSRDQKGT